MAVHALKGRSGMLGMTALYTVADQLERAIDDQQPCAEMLLAFDDLIDQLSRAIREGLMLAEPEASSLNVEPKMSLPHGPPSGEVPSCVCRLLECLRRGDSDSGEVADACLSELKHGDWGPCLQNAMSLIKVFNFAAAIELLTGDDRLAGRKGE